MARGLSRLQVGKSAAWITLAVTNFESNDVSVLLNLCGSNEPPIAFCMESLTPTGIG